MTQVKARIRLLHVDPEKTDLSWRAVATVLDAKDFMPGDRVIVARIDEKNCLAESACLLVDSADVALIEPGSSDQAVLGLTQLLESETITWDVLKKIMAAGPEKARFFTLAPSN